MGGGRDKKKKAKDPLKKAALAAKKADKADKVAQRRLVKEGEASEYDDDHDDGCSDRRRGRVASSSASGTNNDNGGGGGGGGDDWDAILESYRRRTNELTTAELVIINDPFPRPPRGNFTWTLCPSNGMFYMVSVSSFFPIDIGPRSSSPPRRRSSAAGRTSTSRPRPLDRFVGWLDLLRSNIICTTRI
jgi:hypothetical protein